MNNALIINSLNVILLLHNVCVFNKKIIIIIQEFIVVNGHSKSTHENTINCLMFNVRSDDKSVPPVQCVVTASDLMSAMASTLCLYPSQTSNPFHLLPPGKHFRKRKQLMSSLFNYRGFPTYSQCMEQ